MTRVAVVDIGTNSTRLLIADVAPGGAIADVHRESIVTRLGHGVDATGSLDAAAVARVFAVLERYRALIDDRAVAMTTGVLTSAVRDARDGADFTAAVNARFAIGARTIGGDEEAALTYAGATSERPRDGRRVVVVDIGGGSTEFVAGRDGDVAFHVSTQAGVVRQTERHVASDPPLPADVAAIGADAAAIFHDAVPAPERDAAEHVIAVAGTATSCAAIELRLDPYDPSRVHGHQLARTTCERILATVTAMSNAQRRAITGLHPDRAPTIVAGVAMLIEVMRMFDVPAVEVSEHDILRGAALRLARAGTPHDG